MMVEDQGRGVLFSHMVVAEEYLKKNGKPVNDENMMKTIMKLAHEKAESYTPSEELGKNPEAHISESQKKLAVPWLYGKTNMVEKMRIPESEKTALRIELGGAINHITQTILKRVYGFKIKGEAKSGSSDPTKISDFEYVAKGPKNKFSKEDYQRYNDQVDLNRQIRVLVETYIATALVPLLNENKQTWYATMESIYDNSQKRFRENKKNFPQLIKAMQRDFFEKFGTKKARNYLARYRFNRNNRLTKLKGKSLG